MNDDHTASVGVIGEALRGARLLGRGLRLVGRRPRLFGLGVLPPLLTSIVFVIVLVITISHVDQITVALTPGGAGWAEGLVLATRILVGLALVGGVVLLMVVSFTALTLTAGAPLYDKLAEAVEAEFGPVPELDEPVGRGLSRGLRQSVALIGLSLLGASALFVIGLVPLVGQVLGPVLSALFGGWMLSQELTGSAFERRGLLDLAARRATLRRHRARVLGFGVPTFLLLAIPFAGALVFPVATAGGTLLARELLGETTVPARDRPGPGNDHRDNRS